MGGRISIGIIETDGSLKTIEAHTKYMPGAIVNEAFAKEGDVSELREFLIDYENDKFGEGFGKIGNIPCGYGYALVDLRENTFIAAQRFTNFDMIIGAEIANARSFKRGGKGGADGLARMITHKREWDDVSQQMVSIEVGPFKDAKELINNPEALYYEKFGPSRQFLVSYPAWKTEFYDYCERGLEAVRDYLVERNLLSRSEISAWDYALEEEKRQRAEMEENESSFAPEATVIPSM